MLQATRTWISRVLVHPHMLSLICGAAAGTAWIAVCGTYWTAFEPVPAARITFALAWTMTLAVAALPQISQRLSRVPLFWRIGAASCGMAVWPTVWKAVLLRRELIPLDWYAGEWTSLAVMAIPACLILTPAILCGCLLCPAPSLSSSGTQRSSLPMFGVGVALSWCVLPTTLFVRFGADQVLLGLSACLLLGAGTSLFLRGDNPSESGAQSPALNPQPTATLRPQLALTLIAALATLLIGVGLNAANRAAEQLVLESLPLKFFGWAGFLIGAAMSASFGKRSEEKRRAGLRFTLMVIAVASAAVSVLFPFWIRVGIWSSATLSSLTSIVLVKGLIPFSLLLPFGCAAGSLLKHASRRSPMLALLGAGYVLATPYSGTMVQTLLAVVVTSSVVSLTLWTVSEWRALFTHRGWNRQTASLGTGTALLVAAFTCQSWLNPARAARLLFSGHAFAAAGQGDDIPTIERSDRARWLNTIEGENAVWTVWRQQANQLIIRRNGLPAGQMSLDPALGPQNFWSVMTSAVPLVLHPQVNDVLCLGAPEVAEINTLLSFPIQSLTCVAADDETQALIEYEASLATTPSRLQDSRLEWSTVTPSQFTNARATRTYDVIVCPQASALPLRAQPLFTRDFHARIASHLAEDGIFCQRMNIVDFGSAPLVETLRSLRSVFAQTCIITTDGAEVLLLSTNSPAPFVDASLITRLERPQVQQLCGSIGADWSLFSQLAWVSPESIDELLADTRGASNNCVNAHFIMSLPSETLRWGPKWKEKQELFANRTELLFTAMKLEEDDEQDLVRRIQDSQERTRILTEKSDNEWSYRLALKTSLKDRPRTTIQRVKSEVRRTLSSEDQHRKDYLVALGRAAREEFPTLAAIERVETFAEPYDPLVTDFVSFEVAHLLGRSKESDPAREYRHWMRCITYAPAQDRSVRPVAAALDLLRRNPDIVTDPAWRWDQYNLLLDVMRGRWVGRWQAGDPSKYEAADMQHSMEAVLATLSTMDDLASEASIDRETWMVQRRIWEETLASPLRSRQGNEAPKNQMLEAVRQEWSRRNSELSQP